MREPKPSGQGKDPQPRKVADPKIRRKILELLRDGNYRSVACACAGIHPKTLEYWVKRGEEGKRPYLEFLQAMNEAEAQGEAANVTALTLAAQGRLGRSCAVCDAPAPKSRKAKTCKGCGSPLKTRSKDVDTKALMFLLERRGARRWAAQTKLEHSGPDGKPLSLGPKVVVGLPALQEPGDDDGFGEDPEGEETE